MLRYLIRALHECPDVLSDSIDTRTDAADRDNILSRVGGGGLYELLNEYSTDLSSVSSSGG